MYNVYLTNIKSPILVSIESPDYTFQNSEAFERWEYSNDFYDRIYEALPAWAKDEVILDVLPAKIPAKQET